MAAIYQSAQTGKPVSLPAVTRRDAFRGPPLDEGSPIVSVRRRDFEYEVAGGPRTEP